MKTTTETAPNDIAASAAASSAVALTASLPSISWLLVSGAAQEAEALSLRLRAALSQGAAGRDPAGNEPLPPLEPSALDSFGRAMLFTPQPRSTVDRERGAAPHPQYTIELFSCPESAAELIPSVDHLCLLVDADEPAASFTPSIDRQLSLARRAGLHLVLYCEEPLSSTGRAQLEHALTRLGWRQPSLSDQVELLLGAPLEALTRLIARAERTRDQRADAPGWLSLKKRYLHYRKPKSLSRRQRNCALVTGLVRGGSVRVGDAVELVGLNRRVRARVQKITYFKEPISEARRGQYVGLTLEGVLCTELEVNDLLHVLPEEGRARPRPEAPLSPALALALCRSGLEQLTLGHAAEGAALFCHARGCARPDAEERARWVQVAQRLLPEDLEDVRAALRRVFLEALTHPDEGISELLSEVCDQEERSLFEEQIDLGHRLRRLLSAPQLMLQQTLDLLLSLEAGQAGLRATLGGLLSGGDQTRGQAGPLFKRILSDPKYYADRETRDLLFTAVARLIDGLPAQVQLSTSQHIHPQLLAAGFYHGVSEISIRSLPSSLVSQFLTQVCAAPQALSAAAPASLQSALRSDAAAPPVALQRLILEGFSLSAHGAALVALVARAPRLQLLELCLPAAQLESDEGRAFLRELHAFTETRALTLTLTIELPREGSAYPEGVIQSLCVALSALLERCPGLLGALKLKKALNHEEWLALSAQPRLMTLLGEPSEDRARGVSFGERLLALVQGASRPQWEQLVQRCQALESSAEAYAEGIRDGLGSLLDRGEPSILHMKRALRGATSKRSDAIYALLLRVSGGWTQHQSLSLDVNPHFREAGIYQALGHVVELTLAHSSQIQALGALPCCTLIEVGFVEQLEDLEPLLELSALQALRVRTLSVEQLTALASRPRLLALLERGSAARPLELDERATLRERLGSALATQREAAPTEGGDASALDRLATLGARVRAGRPERHAGALTSIELPRGGTLELIYCPPGRFERPSESGGSPQSCFLLEPFLMAQTLVTQAQWSAVMTARGWKDIWRPGWSPQPTQFRGDTRPRERVSWLDCISFCNQLSLVEGLQPVYRLQGKKRVLADLTQSGYRLPTELEFEYAARAGAATVYAGSDKVDEVAWQSSYSTSPVALKAPNAWGFFDLSGNLNEWCDDLWSDEVNHRSPYIKTFRRSLAEELVIRGGSWAQAAHLCQINARQRSQASDYGHTIGFRVVRRP